MKRKDKTVIHLFQNEKDLEGDTIPRRKIFSIFGHSVPVCPPYVGKRKTLCGRSGHYLFVCTTESLRDVPLNPNRERLCKNCCKHEEAGLKLLGII